MHSMWNSLKFYRLVELIGIELVIDWLTISQTIPTFNNFKAPIAPN